MVEQSETLGPVGAVSSSDQSGVYESLPSTLTATPASVTPVASAGGSSLAQPNSQDIQDAVKQVNVHLANVNRVLQLSVDAGSGLTIATIKNSQTGEVLQQYPGTDLVNLAKMLADWSPGKNVLLDLMA